MILLLLILLLWGSPSVEAANHYVLAGGGAGTKDGSDWSNACDDFTGSCAVASLTRGDTYYVAGGVTYASRTFDTAASGTTLITIQKATGASHGTDTGWLASYGTSVAAWGVLTFNTSYWTFDGSSGGGPGAWTTGHGFTFSSAACDSSSFISLYDAMTGFTANHIAFSQTGNVDVCSPGGSGFYQVGILSNSTFGYNYFSNLGGLPWGFRHGSGNIFQYNYVGHICGESVFDVNWHCEAIVIHNMDDIHFRWNFFTECPSSGCFVMNATLASDVADSVRIYGNTFLSGGPGTTGVPIACNSQHAANWRIFNNTAVGISTNIISGDCVRDAGNLAYNNILYNGSAVSSFLTGITHDYNYYSKDPAISCQMSSGANENVCVECSGGCDTITATTDPFVNSSGVTPESFRLTAAIAGNPGTDVCALDACTGEKKYNLDAFGVGRGNGGVWDRGAYSLIRASTTIGPGVTLWGGVTLR